MIVFAVHYVKIFNEPWFDIILKILLQTLWIDWWSLFPIILGCLLKVGMSSHSIRWCLINVLELISILLLSTMLVEVFLILSMISRVVFTMSDMGSIVPWWSILHVINSSWASLWSSWVSSHFHLNTRCAKAIIIAGIVHLLALLHVVLL